MSESVELPLGEKGHLVDPPIVDHLHYDAPGQRYLVTFIPDDNVSHNEKEVVVIAKRSSDGKRVSLRLRQLSTLFGKTVESFVHGGGGDFSFGFSDNSTARLSDGGLDPATTAQAYIELQDLGMIAQIAFRERALARSGS